MKATGIVRRIDDLGRVVIPKEIRRTLRIREDDPLLKTLSPSENALFYRKISLNWPDGSGQGIHKNKFYNSLSLYKNKPYSLTTLCMVYFCNYFKEKYF